MNRVTRKLVSLIGIVAVVFAQLAVSAYACPMEFAALDEAVGVPETNSSGRDASAPALCQKHCENAQQNVNDTPQPLAGVSLASAVVVTLAIDRAMSLPAKAATSSLHHATSPPLSIRNCCFRI